MDAAGMADGSPARPVIEDAQKIEFATLLENRRIGAIRPC